MDGATSRRARLWQRIQEPSTSSKEAKKFYNKPSLKSVPLLSLSTPPIRPSKDTVKGFIMSPGVEMVRVLYIVVVVGGVVVVVVVVVVGGVVVVVVVVVVC